METLDYLRDRLHAIDFRFEEDQLAHAERLVRSHGFIPDELSDLALMTICVGAYRRDDSDLPAWV
ncbi:MAG TPA: hypothetical protein VF998_10345 [Candidatus Limnocylindria bacterium]